MYWAEKYQVSN